MDFILFLIVLKYIKSTMIFLYIKNDKVSNYILFLIAQSASNNIYLIFVEYFYMLDIKITSSEHTKYTCNWNTFIGERWVLKESN